MSIRAMRPLGDSADVPTNPDADAIGGRPIVTWVMAGAAVLLAGGWYVSARVALAAATQREDRSVLERAHAGLDRDRALVQARLKSECQVLSEDPRLKSTLATRGIDEQTMADILGDLRKLTDSGLLAVLTPAGRVMAVVGEPSLSGLDLSGSSVVKAAEVSAEAALGTWVVGERLFEVGIAALRFSDNLIGYLVTGSSFGPEVLSRNYQVTGIPVALILSGKVVASAPQDPGLQPAFSALAAEQEPFTFKSLGIQSDNYSTRLVELGGSTPPARLAWIRSSDAGLDPFSTLSRLLWGPLLLVALFGCWVAWKIAPIKSSEPSS